MTITTNETLKVIALDNGDCLCPNCLEEVDFIEHFEFCQDCGQELDWSDADIAYDSECEDYWN